MYHDFYSTFDSGEHVYLVLEYSGLECRVRRVFLSLVEAEDEAFDLQSSHAHKRRLEGFKSPSSTFHVIKKKLCSRKSIPF